VVRPHLLIDRENIILTGRVIERRKDRQTYETRILIRGRSLEAQEAEAVVVNQQVHNHPIHKPTLASLCLPARVIGARYPSLSVSASINAMIGWSSCSAVQRDPARVSGAWVPFYIP
jgi:hypothetical protein